jgi:hypothetical protein
MIKFIANAISRFQQRSASLPLSFSVSPLSCCLATPFANIYKPCSALSCYQLINVFCKSCSHFKDCTYMKLPLYLAFTNALGALFFVLNHGNVLERERERERERAN